MLFVKSQGRFYRMWRRLSSRKSFAVLPGRVVTAVPFC
jgi:hypothetical protein